MTCSAESCMECQQGRFCIERHGTPTTRRHPRTMADAFPDVRAGQLFVPVEDPPLFTPDEAEGWALYVIYIGLLVAIGLYGVIAWFGAPQWLSIFASS